MGGVGEANNGSGTAGDWAVAVNEKANVKTEPHKTIVANLKQFLMPMEATFRAGPPRRASEEDTAYNYSDRRIDKSGESCIYFGDLPAS